MNASTTAPDVRVRVLIVDPQEVFRRGVRAIVEDDPRYELVGETARESQAAGMAGSTAADVVVYDPGTHAARVCDDLASL